MAIKAGEFFPSTGIWKGMPSTRAYLPVSLFIRSGIIGCPPLSVSGFVQLLKHEREYIFGGVLAHEDIQVTITWYHVQGVVVPAVLVEKLETAHLALCQEAEVLLPGKKGDTGVCLGLLSQVVYRQCSFSIH